MIRVSAALGAVLTVWLTAPHAWQDPPATAPVSAPAPKPLVPAAASSIAANPLGFYGQNVSVTASVDRLVSATSFVVDQDVRKSGGGEVLVLAPQLNAPLKVNSYVTVIGEVIDHDGRPAIRATSVIDSSMVDLARRVPPPMTPDEVAFDALMKQIGPAFNAIRQAVAAAGSDTAASHAATLKQRFIEVEAFWKKRDKADAVKWSTDARTQSQALDQAVAAGKWDEVKAAASALQQTCSACHGAYRERHDDGSYRIR
ncbi:MAG TPA: hypothetical protein VJ813_17175 [Vicinamibacterales bacterium]|nr:hypothetical protein [Vicinamibacterales bacterium]